MVQSSSLLTLVLATVTLVISAAPIAYPADVVPSYKQFESAVNARSIPPDQNGTGGEPSTGSKAEGGKNQSSSETSTATPTVAPTKTGSTADTTPSKTGSSTGTSPTSGGEGPTTPSSAPSASPTSGDSSSNSNDGTIESPDYTFVYLDKTLDQKKLAVVPACPKPTPRTSTPDKDTQDESRLADKIPVFPATVPPLQIEGQTQTGGNCFSCYEATTADKAGKVYLVGAITPDDDMLNVGTKAFNMLVGTEAPREMGVMVAMALVANSNCGL